MGQVDAVRRAARAYLLGQSPPSDLLRRRALRLQLQVRRAEQRVNNLCTQLDAERRNLLALQAQAASNAGLLRGKRDKRAVDKLCAALRRAFAGGRCRGAAAHR